MEVPELTTETRRVLANPDGTFTAEVSAGPVRVRRDDGWVKVDPTLVRRSDGSVGPKAVPIGLAFSGGGSGPLASIADEGKSLGLGWRRALPEPVLSGPTATYPAVLPDVDLVLQAGVEGFSTYFVVKTPEAAANPELAELSFALSASGVSATENAEGEFEAKDGQGRPIFAGPQARMWDSSGRDSAPGDVIQEPMESRSAEMPVEVSGSQLSVTPDHDLLRGSETVYPVVIDPGVSQAVQRTYWTMVSSNGMEFPNHATEHARVGYDESEDDTSRVFYRFDTTAFAGKHILSAVFTHKQIHSPQLTCGGTAAPAVQLGRTAAISSSTAWPGPTWYATLDSNSTIHGHRDTCAGYSLQEWDAEAGVEQAAAKSSPLTLGLRSADETDKWGWRNYDNDASYPMLSVEYNSIPDKPTSVKISEPSTPCVASAASAPVISDATPTFQGHLTDADGASAELKARFEVFTSSGTSPIWQVLYPTAMSSGTTVQVTVPAGELAENTVYKFRVRAEESIATTPAEATDYGPYSGYCYFKVDTGRPAPPTVTSTTYPPYDSDNTTAHGGIGVVGTFTFDGDADVTTYWYRFNDGPLLSVTPATPGAPATVSFRPSKIGVNLLDVYAEDAAGNISTTYDYDFNVARGSGPVGVWKFDETSGVTAADSAGGPHPRPMTVAGGPAGWSAQGRLAGSLRLDGVDDYASTAAAAVSTYNSFTVAAWVRLDSTATFMAVARQAHGSHNSFLLYYSKSANRWGFQRQDPNDPGKSSTAMSASPPAVGAWTHLAGVYDGGSGRLLLYVNGVLEGTAAYAKSFHVTDPFEIGRWSYPGVAGVPFKGRIDQVQLWNRWLAPEELVSVIDLNDDDDKEQPALVGHWKFDETAGSIAADSSGYGATATLGSGASWVSDPVRGQVLRVDSTWNGYARTATNVPVIDGKGSFTITAWAKPASPSARGAVVAQGSHSPVPGGARESYGLRLSREDPARWRFDRLDSGWKSTSSLSSNRVLEAEDYGEWVHLAAVYDRVKGRMFLYVNGVRQGAPDGYEFSAPWHGATGPVWFGGELPGTDVATTFAGELDDVRMYTGVMSEAQIYQQWSTG
ncbi:LamG domain-containing protein [Actinopolymorpha pittospori]